MDLSLVMMEQLLFVWIKIILLALLTNATLGQKPGVLYLAGGCFWCTEKSFQDFPE